MSILMNISELFNALHALTVCPISVILGAAGAFFTIRYAAALGLVDRPDTRSSHNIPTPKGGGVGILLSFIFTALYLHIHAMLWIPAALISLMSYAGDRTHIPPLIRLGIQFTAAVLLVGSVPVPMIKIITLSAENVTLQMFLRSCCILAAAVYVTGTANFYNFMDGIDGMAAVTGITGFSMMAMYGITAGYDPSLAVLNLSLACACLGFLPFNIPEAGVFMGDVGSILLGFIFGAITLSMATDFIEFAVLCSFIFPFYADELITMRERIKDGERLLAPHRRHLYQVMANEGGIAHWKVSCGYGAVQFLAGAGTWGVYSLRPAYVPGLLLCYATAFLLINNRIKGKYA